MSNQTPNFNVVDFFTEYEKVIAAYRQNDGRRTTVEQLPDRQLSERESAPEIYDRLNNRINWALGHCAQLSADEPNVGGETSSEKSGILCRYFGKEPRPGIHVIQGPPGTGKTELSAIYILLYLLEWHVTNPPTANGKRVPVIAVSAFTHKAVDNVLLRIERLFPLFYALALHKKWISPISSRSPCQQRNLNEECLNCFFPFARMIKLHAQERRSGFKGKDDDGLSEVSEFAPELVFSNRNDRPTDDTSKPLGLHDMRVNWSNLAWFLTEANDKKPEECPEGACTFEQKNQFQSCTTECLLKRIQEFDRPTIIGCTTSQLIKLQQTGGNGNAPTDLKVDFLLLDEASMMMLPDFLPLAARVKDEGHLVVVGDDLQLGPISQNDWTREIRPSLVEHKPWNSVFHYLRRMANPKKVENNGFQCYYDSKRTQENSHVAWSALETTFRLTVGATKLIKPAYERADVDLKPFSNEQTGTFELIQCDKFVSPLKLFCFKECSKGTKLCDNSGNHVSLVTYENHEAATENKHESEIIKELLKHGLIPASAKGAKKKDIKQSVAIVTPYHDQINLLRKALGDLFEAGKIPDWLLIDTVNKLQGDERDVVIFSACASGTENLMTHGGFVMELQRTNVAFSRAKKQLIVIGSQSLLDYIPSGFQEYQAALLWKNLRTLCVSSRNRKLKLVYITSLWKIARGQAGRNALISDPFIECKNGFATIVELEWEGKTDSIRDAAKRWKDKMEFFSINPPANLPDDQLEQLYKLLKDNQWGDDITKIPIDQAALVKLLLEQFGYAKAFFASPLDGLQQIAKHQPCQLEALEALEILDNIILYLASIIKRLNGIPPV